MRYDAEKLKEFSVQVMCRSGLSREESEIFSDSLIRADLRGIASHGVSRLSTYSKRVELGLVSGRVTPQILQDGGSILSVDGKNGMGAYVGWWCMDLCIRRARERGSCFAAAVHGMALNRLRVSSFRGMWMVTKSATSHTSAMLIEVASFLVKISAGR